MLSPTSHIRDSRACQQCGQPGTEHQGAAASCPAPMPTMIDVVGVGTTVKCCDHKYTLHEIVDYLQMRRGNPYLVAALQFLLLQQQEAHQLQRHAEVAEAKLALIRATATRGVPCLINLAAIDRILNDGKEVARG